MTKRFPIMQSLQSRAWNWNARIWALHSYSSSLSLRIHTFAWKLEVLWLHSVRFEDAYAVGMPQKVRLRWRIKSLARPGRQVQNWPYLHAIFFLSGTQTRELLQVDAFRRHWRGWREVDADLPSTWSQAISYVIDCSLGLQERIICGCYGFEFELWCEVVLHSQFSVRDEARLLAL